MYLVSLVLVIFAVLLVCLSALGVFSSSEKTLEQTLKTHHEFTVDTFNEQFDLLSAQSIALSSQATIVLEGSDVSASAAALKDDPAAIQKAEESLLPMLETVLRSGPCNGVYIILDATVNSKAKNAETSRAGVYLRYANLNSKNSVDQDVAYYRGMFSVAQDHNIELHNRWRMEFDTSLIPLYPQYMSKVLDEQSLPCVITSRSQLSDTWENVMYLVVPIINKEGEPQGICGVELSDLYLRLSYPTKESDFGNVITIFAPVVDGELVVPSGMTGELKGINLDSQESLKIEEGNRYNKYYGKDDAYLGIQSKIDFDYENNSEFYVVTLVSEELFNAAVETKHVKMVLFSIAFLAVMIVLSVYLSRRFAKPIIKSLEILKNTGDFSLLERTGITEIDALVNYLDQGTQSSKEQNLPEEIQELLNDFSEKVATLTATERRIVHYYADGKTVAEVAEVAFISIHTVRKHNANIYRKLCIGSKDELQLYVELFRRCGRLEELFGALSNNESK